MLALPPAAPLVFLATCVCAGAVYWQGTIFMAAATVAYGLLVLGLVFRFNRRLHPVLMLAGMIIDISIVLILEVQRNAIDTALSFSLGPMQQAHIGCSTIALLLYFPTIAMGWKLWKRGPQPGLRKWHIRVAVASFCFRTLGFLLMLSFLGHANRNEATANCDKNCMGNAPRPIVGQSQSAQKRGCSARLVGQLQ
jgi:hypothetical protein